MQIDVESRIDHYEDDEYEPRYSNGSSLCIFPPLMRIEPRRSMSYNKLYQEPLKLTVRKLDGSFFAIEVSKIGTVGELKRAVEAAFDHLPRKGPGRVSWEHVWGQFCLCHEGQKLLTNSDPIGMFGIKDGDELQFIHHASSNLVRIQSDAELCDSDDEHGMSNDVLQNSRKYTSVNTEDPEEKQERDVGLDGDVISRCEYRIAHLFRVWFSYRKLNNPEERTNSSKFSSMIGSFKNCLRSSNKYEARNKSLKGK